MGFPISGSKKVLPKVGRKRGFPKVIKRFSGLPPVTAVGFLFADYGNPMDTLNFQIHFLKHSRYFDVHLMSKVVTETTVNSCM